MKKIIAKTDPQVIEAICNGKINIISIETAHDKWRYNDGRVEENEIKGLAGNTKKGPKEIRIRESMKNEQAAKTLFHEMGHMTRPQSTTRDEGLKEEIDVRVETEEFAIRQGMLPTRKGYRTADGKVDRTFIENKILKSKHYNPKGRRRIGRRYAGEKHTAGWCPP
ncbi:MAG: hypothetical protein DRR16_09480 [Candidatus Parabeggiatoa sp. nov. 3]|nr:MAG: hypothetical protein DRR00_15620 [Gammaproteobacteria bacterium]RKZ65696.1 MAG: hypothetical protein DRQ99_11890 [Gammaproteobacteria bacterium]RKZ86545.1 MAG: hypothetical protein DRR16_09480 [Gammaproteobacteria bacterium]